MIIARTDARGPAGLEKRVIDRLKQLGKYTALFSTEGSTRPATVALALETSHTAAGDVVVLDNLAAPKVDGVRRAIAAAGASLLYRPPYSPDLNSIEQFLAKLKALLRKAAARTKDDLWQAIGRLLETCSPSESANDPRHCGYDSI